MFCGGSGMTKVVPFQDAYRALSGPVTMMLGSVMPNCFVRVMLDVRMRGLDPRELGLGKGWDGHYGGEHQDRKIAFHRNSPRPTPLL